VREFIALTQTGERTALGCLAAYDWKLDAALDNYFANPELYYREGPHAMVVSSPQNMASNKAASVDRKKIESLFARYKG
jgi:DCN1-like protein 1/2